MAIKIIGQSVFMEFEHLAKNDRDANTFIKNVTKINRELTLMENPKPERTRTHKRHRHRWMRGTLSASNNPQLDTWREANKQYRLSITIERV